MQVIMTNNYDKHHMHGKPHVIIVSMPVERESRVAASSAASSVVPHVPGLGLGNRDNLRVGRET